MSEPGTSTMRILFVIKSLVQPGGGAEKVLCCVASELARRGHEVTVAAFDGPRKPDFYAFGPEVHRRSLGDRDLTGRSRIWQLIRTIGGLRGLLRRERHDVAIGFMHSAFLPLLVAAKGSGVPIVASEHTAADHYRRRMIDRLLIKWSAPHFAAHTVVSDAVQQGFWRMFGIRTAVVPNPTQKTVQGVHSQGSRTVLCVGSFRPEKDHSTLIRAFATVAHSSDWKLRLVGDGPLRPELEALVEKLGIDERVQFTGAVTDVFAEYASADLFAMPSKYESFGMATAEALASGVPALGFRSCPGTSELIIDGVNGLLVDGKDRVAALAAGLSRLMASDELRATMGRAAPATVSKYSLESVVDRWEEVLRSVISNGSRT